jgi:thiamine-phosphate pyrophosphorylase
MFAAISSITVCKVRDLAAGTKTRVLVNDRLDIALASGVDGVHLPSRSAGGSRASACEGYWGSTHSLQEAKAAEQAHDFIVFGPSSTHRERTPSGLILFE